MGGSKVLQLAFLSQFLPPWRTWFLVLALCRTEKLGKNCFTSGNMRKWVQNINGSTSTGLQYIQNILYIYYNYIIYVRTYIRWSCFRCKTPLESLQWLCNLHQSTIIKASVITTCTTCDTTVAILWMFRKTSLNQKVACQRIRLPYLEVVFNTAKRAIGISTVRCLHIHFWEETNKTTQTKTTTT